MDDVTREEFLSDLCPRVRPLIVQLMDCECGCEALDFFRTRPRTWLETADIAYHLSQSGQDVAVALGALTQIGVVERQEILYTAFFSLTRDAEILDALDQYWVWRDTWNTRWHRVRETLKF